MSDSKRKPETISPEVMEELRSIHKQIKDYEEKIWELKDHADSLVPKHDLAECREFGCTHTHHCQSYCQCHSWCVRSRYAHGAYRDCYEQKKAVIKPPENYPMLGWKSVACVGSHWNNEWHPKKIIKETDKTLILEDKTQLLKSTIFILEDCTFIKDRSEYIFMCADNPETLDMQKTLLDVANAEWRERNRGHYVPMEDAVEFSDGTKLKL